MCALSSHGDTKHILLIPSGPKECFEMAQTAFDLADRFQTPVFVMTDLDLGMNVWVDKEFEYKTPKFDRGKVLSKEDLDRVEKFGRYLDVDGDGVCYRTLPGTNHIKAGYFTRGSGHDEYARYTESPVVYARNMDRLLKKWHTAKKHVPKPIETGNPKSKTGVIAFGTSHHAVVEAMDRMVDQPFRYLRLLSYPVGPEVEEFIRTCEVVHVVEQNRDGQMHQLLQVDIPGYQDKLKSIRYYGGFPLSADVVERELRKAMKK